MQLLIPHDTKHWARIQLAWESHGILVNQSAHQPRCRRRQTLKPRRFPQRDQRDCQLHEHRRVHVYSGRDQARLVWAAPEKSSRNWNESCCSHSKWSLHIISKTCARQSTHACMHVLNRHAWEHRDVNRSEKQAHAIIALCVITLRANHTCTKHRISRNTPSLFGTNEAI